MVSHLQPHQQSLLQHPVFDDLYCDEERFDDDLCFRDPSIEDSREIHREGPSFLGFLFEHDLFWEDEEILTLLSKEKTQTHAGHDGSLAMARNDAVRWMLRVIGRYGFTATTAVLAVNYYDRFVASLCYQKDKPWTSQLVAVACLSVAAKMEETRVPLLLDFQVEEPKYMFEAKTIQRMELLVLSALKWKMNPVTPISFFDHIVRRFELLTNNPHSEFVQRCGSIILSIITDCRFVQYLPSVIAAAVMRYVIKEIDTCDTLEYQYRLMSALRTNKEKTDDCYEFILEAMDDHVRTYSHKRKHNSIPSSPSGVIDAYLSSDSSNDSWTVGPSMSSSPEPLSKRSRAQVQHMRLAPLSSLYWCG